MSSRKDTESIYSNKAVTSYTGRGDDDTYAFSQTNVSEYDDYEQGSIKTDFYEEEPLRLDNEETSENRQKTQDEIKSEQALQQQPEDMLLEEVSDWHSLQTWVYNEINSPEVLEYKDVLVETLADLSKYQIDRIEELREYGDMNSRLESMVLQNDVERTKYIIRMYLQTRLKKIEKYAKWYTSSQENAKNLTKNELVFAQKIVEASQQYNEESFLNEMPTALKATDGVDLEGLSLVRTPKADQAVFCRVVEDIGDFRLDSSGETVFMEKNNIFITSYKNIDSLVKTGSIQLL